MNVGSLFAGIGGLELGLERAGMRTAWQVELDEFCRAILAERFPGAKQHADVREVGAHNLAPVGLVAGGFPCQPVSNNGHGLGDADERWLWPEFARIVRELRPSYVIVENVSALVGRGLSDVLGGLAALRYDAEWACLRASDAGAPHRRERLFIVAYPECVGSQEGPRVFDGRGLDDLPQPEAWGSLSRRGSDGRLRRAPHPDVLRVADGFPTGMDGDRLRAAGNAVVPQVAEWIGRRIVAYERGRLSDAA